jgi:hypothetical protein
MPGRRIGPYVVTDSTKRKLINVVGTRAPKHPQWDASLFLPMYVKINNSSTINNAPNFYGNVISKLLNISRGRMTIFRQHVIMNC